MKYPHCQFALALTCWFAPIFAGAAQEQASSAIGKATQETAAAAQTFLATLDDGQRGKVVYDFKDSVQRQRWSNLPTSSVKRGGLRMGDLTPSQRAAAFGVLKAVLSPQGYEKVMQIMEGDEFLKKNGRGGPGPGGPPAGANAPSPTGGAGGPAPAGPAGAPGGPRPGSPGGGRGGPPAFGHDEYYISFLGQPSATEPWMIQFGGHHLALNITLAGGRGTLAPSHTAAQPAKYELEGKTVRPLGRETDKAFALLESLDEAQRKKAVFGYEMRDLALGPGRDGQTIQPEGIKGAELNEKQREMLLDLASEWTGIQNEASAKAKLEEVRKSLAETWFGWSGPTERGAAAYFRVQGPTLIIEYAPQKLGGNPTNHLHTMYRDPTNDYGVQWWKR